jgi:uncharacterized membrane protein YozB (DUF420 family)
MTSIPQSRPHAKLWIAAATVAALGTWVLYDAHPGINWGIWTTIAAAGLFLFVGEKRGQPLIIVAFTAVIIAFGAAVTADEFMIAMSVIAVMFYLAVEMLLSNNPRFDRITTAFFVPAPVIAFATALTESVRRGVDALHIVRSHRARSMVRGIVITIPVFVVFALLLSTADPVFASWRDTIEKLLASWEFLPRTFFFVAMLAIVLGAYGFADRSEPPAQLNLGIDSTRRWLGSTERLILLGSVAVLFWTFLIVQLSYLFGNVPQTPGSEMTFAEYARRGFGELTVVASASVILILASERFGARENRQGVLRALTLAIIVAVLLLLGSAFNRVLLYEDAYGFTTARLYAQSYMLVLAVALVALAVETRNELEVPRLFRRALVAATTIFVVLIYWNHSAWIANKNVDRLASTGKLDTSYLTRDLSFDAVPTLVERLPTIPEPFQNEIRTALKSRYAKQQRRFGKAWYEWNLRTAEAKKAFATLQ